MISHEESEDEEVKEESGSEVLEDKEEDFMKINVMKTLKIKHTMRTEIKKGTIKQIKTNLIKKIWNILPSPSQISPYTGDGTGRVYPHPFVIEGGPKIPSSLPKTSLLLSLMNKPYIYHDGHVFNFFDTKKGKKGI